MRQNCRSAGYPARRGAAPKNIAAGSPPSMIPTALSLSEYVVVGVGDREPKIVLSDPFVGPDAHRLPGAHRQ